MIELDQAGRGRESQVILPPDPSAGGWLEYAWVQHHLGSPLAHRSDWRIVPDAAPHVLVHRYPRGLTHAQVVGPRSRGVARSIGPRLWTAGLRLRPGALAALLREPAHAWVDRGVGLEATLPAPLRPRLGDLARFEDPGSVARELAALLALALGGRGPDWRVGAFLRTAAADPASATPAAIARSLGMAPRTLRSVLRGELGLSPRSTLRISRVQRAAALITGGSAPTLSRIAHTTGFADHAHLTREFGCLMGESPTAYRARAPGGAGTFKPGPPGPGDPSRTVRL